MDKSERTLFMKALGGSVREYVQKLDVRIRAWVSGELKALTDLLDERIKAIPQPIQGERGEKGEKGDRGEVGESIKGDKGDIGERGEAGEKGDPGQVGPKGERGDPGESIRGEKGEKGDRGERGESGIVGERGEKGEPGESIRGEKGERGERGDRGEIGPPGESIRGERGEKGDPGLPGEKGEKGEQGLRGEIGERGERGLDAFQFDILPAIDTAKSYPRGTLATHAGGLCWAWKNTIPSVDFVNSGWQVIVNGTASEEPIESDNPREFGYVRTLTDGRRLTFQRIMDVPLVRGIWEPGQHYAKADIVQRDGSMWICNVAGTKAGPGNNTPDWTLCTKHGRDGKDGKGERGPMGPAGRDGRDLTQMAFDGSKH